MSHINRNDSDPFLDEEIEDGLLMKIFTIATFILLLASLSLTALGIWGLIEAGDLRERAELLSDLPVEAVAYCIIFLGGISSLACYAGLHGSCTTKAHYRRLLLSIYLFTLFCVMLIQLCMSVFLYQYGTEQALNDVVEDRWFEEGEDAMNRRVNYQDYFDCCGWANAYDSRASGYNTPCPRSDPSACRQATMDWFNSQFFPIAIFGMVLAICEVFAVGATVGILMHKKKIERDWDEGF